MIKHDITFLPSGKKAQIREGISILNAARIAGVYIPTRCGGKMGCLMCKIQTQEPFEQHLSPAAAAERRKLGALYERGFRLSCQAKIQGDVTVIVPEDKLKAAVRKQLEAARQQEDDSLW